MTTLAEFIAAEKARLAGGRHLVANWREHVPASSRWRPGDMGDPNCPACKGVGYVRVEVPVGHPQFGKLLECDCAAERLANERAQKLRRAAGVALEDLDLTWRAITRTPALEAALSAVRETLARGWGWCYLYGPPGPGKTLLLKIAVAEAVRAGQGAVLVHWADLLNHLRAGFDAGDYQARLDAWRDTPILAVDEFGRAKETEWVREAQALIFNHRYETALARKTITLFASNFAPEDGDPWFADRIRDARFHAVLVTGPSMRPLMEAAE